MPIKVLQILSGLEQGGVEKVVERYYKNFDREIVQCDFITHRPSGIVEKEISNTGCNIYHLAYRRKHPFLSAVQTFRIIKKNQYKIVHIHGNMEVLPELIASKLAGARVRIVHSHMSFFKPSRIKLVINEFFMFFVKIISTDLFACSNVAGEWAYGKQVAESSKYRLVYNALDPKDFKYSDSKRNKIRQNFGIEDDFLVYGFVGRLCFQKNPEYLLRVFKYIHENISKSRLIIIGSGEKEEELKSFVAANGLTNSVVLISSAKNVDEFMCAFDALILPSRYEGLGIVAIEAQYCGLRVFISSFITKEVEISNLLYWIDIKSDPKESARIIVECTLEQYSRNTKITCDNYNIKVQAQLLQDFYIRRATNFEK